MMFVRSLVFFFVALMVVGVVAAEDCRFNATITDCTAVGGFAIMRWASTTGVVTDHTNAHAADSAYAPPAGFAGVVCCKDIGSGSNPTAYLSSDGGDAHLALNDVWTTPNRVTVMSNVPGTSVETLAGCGDSDGEVCIVEVSSADNAHIAECGSNSFSYELCGVGFEDCSNSIDDDGDGLVDCADPECRVSSPVTTANLGMRECAGSIQDNAYCADGVTGANCNDTTLIPAEKRYCSDGNIGEWAYRHDDTGTCLSQTSPIPECVNSYCSGDDTIPDCPLTFTNDDPDRCLDYENVLVKCGVGEGALYDSTPVPKTNARSICCPVGMYAFYDGLADTYECVSTAPCYDPGNPLLYSCYFDAESKKDGSNPSLVEFTNWLGNTTDNPDDTFATWCVAPAPSSGGASQACCREVIFGVLDYYNADEDNVIVY